MDSGFGFPTNTLHWRYTRTKTYPLREVLTAVSINPSRPAIQWKKKSCGCMPVMKRPSMKPPDLGEVSNGTKLGKLLPESMSGGLFPSNSICPRRQEICMVLTVLPLAPATTMSCKLFCGNLEIRPPGRQTLLILLVYSSSACLYSLSSRARKPRRS